MAGKPVRRFESCTLRQLRSRSLTAKRRPYTPDKRQISAHWRFESSREHQFKYLRRVRDAANPSGCKPDAPGNARFDSVALHQFPALGYGKVPGSPQVGVPLKSVWDETITGTVCSTYGTGRPYLWKQKWQVVGLNTGAPIFLRLNGDNLQYRRCGLPTEAGNRVGFRL